MNPAKTHRKNTACSANQDRPKTLMINIANERTTHSNLTMNTLFPQIHRNTRQGLHRTTQQRQTPAKKRYQKTLPKTLPKNEGIYQI
jgi:hypothetical protein